MKSSVLVLLFSLALISCKVKTDSPVSSCSFSEEHFGGSGTVYVSNGQKIAQRFRLGKNIGFKTATIEMDLHTSTSVKFSLFADNSGSPAGASVLSQTTINSSLVTNSGKITFTVSNTQLNVGSYYYMILEPVGGDIKVIRKTQAPFGIDGEIWTYNGAWSSSTAYDFSLGITGTCESMYPKSKDE